MAKWACDTTVSKMYLDRTLAVYCAHSTLDTHYTARKKTPIPPGPAWNELCELWISTSAEARQGNEEP